MTHTALRFGTRLGADPKLEDMMWTSLTDMLTGTPMGVTAENLAAKFDVTRSAFTCVINCKSRDLRTILPGAIRVKL